MRDDAQAKGSGKGLPQGLGLAQHTGLGCGAGVQMEQMGQNQRRCVCFVQYAKRRYQSDARQRCLVEFTK